ncbi:MAG: hydrogenase maturation nickel metallochaperone HypA [Thermoanaerobaculia bacterium]
MHEYSLVRSLLDRVDLSVREHGATSVAALRVRIGEVAGVEMELFASAFELARSGTSCAAAELEIVPGAARWECTSCGVEAPRGGVLRCPACGAPVRLAAGDEIVLERIEMEVPEHV